MKWEYMTLMIPATGFLQDGEIDGQNLTDRLNQLGSERWELVSVFEGQTGDVFAVLKRALA